MNQVITGKASDFERLHEIAVRRHGCVLVRGYNKNFRAIVPAVASYDVTKQDIMSLKGVTEEVAS